MKKSFEPDQLELDQLESNQGGSLGLILIISLAIVIAVTVAGMFMAEASHRRDFKHRFGFAPTTATRTPAGETIGQLFIQAYSCGKVTCTYPQDVQQIKKVVARDCTAYLPTFNQRACQADVNDAMMFRYADSTMEGNALLMGPTMLKKPNPGGRTGER